jgi:hypothetical protein
MVDLAPDAAVRLTYAHLKLHAQKRLQRKNMAVVRTAIAIGGILKKYRVRKVLFISCNVGGSKHFLGEMAGLWGNRSVEGYRHIIVPAWIEFTRGKKTWYLYLDNKPPKTDAEKRERSTNYPKLGLGDSWSMDAPGRSSLIRSRTRKVPPRLPLRTTGY